ncbi:MAG TPA: PSD1 and planctomycete cytochrome C domain-containing protein [Verrucomicrobiaceae bacterium]
MAAGSSGAATDEKGVEFFEIRIRPLLVQRCYECHSTEKGKTKGGLSLDSREAVLQGGDSGPALVAGDPDKSKLVEGIRWKNQDFQMPPKKQLSDQEVEDFETWIRMGAPDPRAKVAVVAGTKSKRTIDIAEGRNFWSFRPIGDPAVPKVHAPSWVKTPVDAFVLAGLESAGLHPARPADKRTLIRRATFDLTGLPPTPEDVAAFVSDDTPDAFAKVIERLLKSPAYGERWGRHWLDVARYADSNGMDENVGYGHSWRYRDYVVQAFNKDKPFDRFLVEQLAGDLLPAGSEAERLENLTATGFLALGAKVLAEPDVRKMRMDVIDEQIDVTGKAFLGMTFGCCRCHDHKFDPVPTADYYALAAIFHSTKSLGDDKTGAIKYWYEHSLATPAQLAAKKAHEASVAAQKKKVTDYIAKARGELKEELQSHAADYLAAAALLPADCGFEEVKGLAGEKGLRARYLLTCRQYLTKNPEHPFFARWRELARSGDAGEVLPYYGTLFTEARLAQKTAKKSAEVIGKGAKAKEGKPPALVDPRLNPAIEALNDAAGFLAIPDKDADAFDTGWFATLDLMNADLIALEDRTPDPPAIMGVTDGDITRSLPVHIRGSYLTLGDECERGFPQVMQTSLVKPILPAKQSGRLELARWMASGEHPLTARVMVNRIWRWHFGRGIVASTDNFGLLGDRPSHPALLDWLARRFIEDGWSVKEMHRLVMNSACYQQSSDQIADSGLRIAESRTNAPVRQVAGEMVNQFGTFKDESRHPPSAIRHPKLPADPALVDPENRLLWRFNLQRLEAEEIRDALLAVSGWLDPRMGGKTLPLRDKEFVFNHTSRDHTTYESPRRAIYLPIIRNHLYDMLEQFDYPDPTMPTGSRNATVVAPQALLMMNGSVVMDAAEKIADQLLLPASSDDGDRIRTAYLLVYGRPASAPEISRARDFLERLRRNLGVNTDSSEKQAWMMFCQTLLGANEFIYLR